jgi:hypothetical protein
MNADFIRNLVDEIMTEMSDDTFRMNTSDRIRFRDLLLSEIDLKVEHEYPELVVTV